MENPNNEDISYKLRRLFICSFDQIISLLFSPFPKQSLGDLLFLLRFLLLLSLQTQFGRRDLLFLLRFLLLLLLLLLLFFLSVHHELVHGRSQELQDRIS